MSKNGLHLITPTSIASTGTGNSSSISANGSVTFSTCATLSLNGVFSADYDNYMIVCRGSQSSGNSNHRLRLRANGTDESSASNYYTYQRLSADSTTVSGTRGSLNLTLFGNFDSAQRNGVVLNIYGPYLTQPTAGRSVVASSYLNAYLDDWAWTHSLSNAYDGFTIFTQSGSTTGLIAVYGMRN